MYRQNGIMNTITPRKANKIPTEDLTRTCVLYFTGINFINWKCFPSLEIAFELILFKEVTNDEIPIIKHNINSFVVKDSL